MIVVEGDRVVWLSHCGRLIRASPEHLRPASLREYHLLPRNESGEVVEEKLIEERGPREFVDLDELPEADPVQQKSSIDASEQPEIEVSPPSTQDERLEQEPEDLSDCTPTVPDPMEVDGVNVPLPEEEDDELFAFGDDIPLTDTEPTYEIHFRVFHALNLQRFVVFGKRMG